MQHAFPCLLTLACALVAPVPAAAQDAPEPWSAMVYLQQSWPKQTETNRQIKQDINGTLGTSFQTWDDGADLNLGLLVFRAVAPKWKAGFEQKYSVHADLQAMVQNRLHGLAHPLQVIVERIGKELTPGSHHHQIRRARSPGLS